MSSVSGSGGARPVRPGGGVAAGLLCAAVAVSSCSAGPERPWNELAEQDLRFIHETLGADHPGPVDTIANPWFRAWYDTGYADALALAREATDYGGLYFAIKRYVHGFQDGHLGALWTDPLRDPRLSFRWPGLVVGYRDSEFEVTSSDDGRIPAGAVLTACDGRSGEELAEGVLQAFHGRWSVPGVRPRLAPYLLLDAGNPFATLPGTCRFEIEGEPVEAVLDWRPIDTDDLRPLFDEARREATGAFRVRSFAAGGGTWISLPTFNLTTDSLGRAFDDVLALLRRDLASIRASELVVLDVRGNGGGSSLLGDEIANTLWGDGASSGRPGVEGVDWRVSPGNVLHVRESVVPRLQERYGPDAVVVRTYVRLADAMEEALRRGESLHRQSFGSRPAARRPPPPDLRARVFLLTDDRCVSACLDFVDVVRAQPGVVHVGRETDADAVYMENRTVDLPSGFGRLFFSMKVYRGRPRGHNESWVPHHVWTGDISDDASLEHWIAQLGAGP